MLTLRYAFWFSVIPWRHCLRGSFSPCHPVIYEIDPVKISIFYYFLDLVPKQLDDYLRAFFYPRRQSRHGATMYYIGVY
ncbi:MAG: hypothetical protein ACRYE8_07240 [Janthinobacterium lividum]